MTFVSVVVLAARGLDLDAEEVGTLAGFGLGDDGDVVGGRVSPGTGDSESLLGGAGHEEELGPFALLFVVSEGGGGVIRHEWSLGSLSSLKSKSPLLPKSGRNGAPSNFFF